MARRLKQNELVALLFQAREDLEAREPHYPIPSAKLDPRAYIQQMQPRSLLQGRLSGLSEATTIILQQRRWGPVSQARAHDALMDASNRAWMEREARVIDLQQVNLSDTERTAYTARYTGQLDALQAVSKAIAGSPQQVRALVDIEHPERARAQMRRRDRDRGAGY